MQTAAMFGLGVDDNRLIKIVPQCVIPLPPASVVFITGPSGSGKTTILRLLSEKAIEMGLHVIRFDELPELADRPLVDVFDLPLEQVTALLALAGLGDAFVMLRKPSQLSDGQRYRLRLAQMFNIAERSDSDSIIIADEFGLRWIALLQRSLRVMRSDGSANLNIPSSLQQRTMIYWNRLSQVY